jgi:hypothetical protein
VAFTSLAILLAYGVSFTLLRRRGCSSGGALLFVGISAAAFLAIQSRDQFGDWDAIDLTTMFLFAYGVFAWQPNVYFVVLFGFEVLNREAAQFIPLWLLLTALTSHPRPEDGIRRRRLATAACLLAVGMLWTQLARKLLVTRPAADIHLVVLGGQYFVLVQNIRQFGYMFHSHGTIVSVGMTAAFALLLAHRRKHLVAPVPTTIVLVAMVISIYAFALIKESRVWTGLIPFMVFLLLPLPGRQDNRHATP